MPTAPNYDKYDLRSILDYAARLTGRTLGDILDGDESDSIVGGAHAKGKLGQILEEGYFGIANNNSPEPDFKEVGLELKVVPIVGGPGRARAKERMILGTLNFDRALKDGFKTFEKKGSHILIVFYKWKENTPLLKYRFLKVVYWSPSEDDLETIRADWNIIEKCIRDGRAHCLSDSDTSFLAACPKGAGGEGDLVRQPFSDRPARRRALSLKASFVTGIYECCPDVSATLEFGDCRLDASPKYTVPPLETWNSRDMFERGILRTLESFVGMNCEDIELATGAVINSERNKAYHWQIAKAMLGTQGKRDVDKLTRADVLMKTVRVRRDGTPKEAMSFPAIRYGELVEEQDWYESTLFGLLDHRFLFMVFGFNTDKPEDEACTDLTFKGAFFWSVPDDDMEVIRGVWEETRDRVDAGDFEHFVGAKDGRIVHIRSHGRDSRDTYLFRGQNVKKRCFWFNASYIKKVVSENIPALRRAPSGSAPNGNRYRTAKVPRLHARQLPALEREHRQEHEGQQGEGHGA